jgi:putative oxidoreductase
LVKRSPPDRKVDVAVAAAAGELASGLLVALGLLGPAGPALMLSVMIVAAVSVHWKGGLFASKNGIELPLLYAVGAATLALTGYGRLSLDAVLGIAASPAITWTLLLTGLAGGVLNLALRRQPVTA